MLYQSIPDSTHALVQACVSALEITKPFVDATAIALFTTALSGIAWLCFREFGSGSRSILERDYAQTLKSFQPTLDRDNPPLPQIQSYELTISTSLNEITDAQWEKMRIHLPRREHNHRRGGPPPVNDRRCFEGILWIVWTGSSWNSLPHQYASPTTCRRRLKAWEENGALLNLWRAYLGELNDQQRIGWNECFAHGDRVRAGRSGPNPVKTNRARAQSEWFKSMAQVLRSEHIGPESSVV